MLHINFEYIGMNFWGESIGESTIVDDYSFSKDSSITPSF